MSDIAKTWLCHCAQQNIHTSCNVVQYEILERVRRVENTSKCKLTVFKIFQVKPTDVCLSPGIKSINLFKTTRSLVVPTGNYCVNMMRHEDLSYGGGHLGQSLFA